RREEGRVMDVWEVIAGMPEEDRDQLARDAGQWATDHGVELTEDLAEQYARAAFAQDHGGHAPEEYAPELDAGQQFFADYAENRTIAHAHEQANADQQWQAVEREIGNLEQQNGRKLTVPEQERLSDQLAHGLELTGRLPDVHATAWNVGIQPW